GIEALSPEDIQFAGDFGYQIKLLAIARFGDGWVEARVHPAMIPKNHILANVNEAYNAIYLEGDFVGPNLFYGLGAGRRPTGSAVVSDIMNVGRKIHSAPCQGSGSLGWTQSGLFRGHCGAPHGPIAKHLLFPLFSPGQSRCALKNIRHPWRKPDQCFIGHPEGKENKRRRSRGDDHA
ncbi:MAG: hypothetical protein B1H13_13010, partial [Desulfobacteraceae bacterium 4484_190.3]